jgi:Ser/Thr protein kinase RdoA (MazF antagonist)
VSIVVTRNQVQASVERAYGLRVLRPLNDLPPGVHSQAWLAHTDDGEWVVKVSDPRCDSPAMLSAQCELYGFLNGRGLHAPEVRADRSGRHVSALAEPDAGLPVTLMRHHEFHRLTPESVSAEDLRHVATQIARLHLTMEEFEKKDEIVADREKSQNEWGRQVVGSFPDLINSPIAGCFTAAERQWIAAIDTACVAYVDANFPNPESLAHAVLHGDLSFEHVRLLPNREVYFFDFGDMCWGPVAHELAQFLRGLFDAPISFERWADLRRWLLEGYRSLHMLTATDAAAIDVFLLNRVVALAKFIRELNADQATADGAEAIMTAYRVAEAVLRKRHHQLSE